MANNNIYNQDKTNNEIFNSHQMRSFYQTKNCYNHRTQSDYLNSQTNYNKKYYKNQQYIRHTQDEYNQHFDENKYLSKPNTVFKFNPKGPIQILNRTTGIEEYNHFPVQVDSIGLSNDIPKKINITFGIEDSYKELILKLTNPDIKILNLTIKVSDELCYQKKWSVAAPYYCDVYEKIKSKTKVMTRESNLSFKLLQTVKNYPQFYEDGCEQPIYPQEVDDFLKVPFGFMNVIQSNNPIADLGLLRLLKIFKIKYPQYKYFIEIPQVEKIRPDDLKHIEPKISSEYIPINEYYTKIKDNKIVNNHKKESKTKLFCTEKYQVIPLSQIENQIVPDHNLIYKNKINKYIKIIAKDKYNEVIEIFYQKYDKELDIFANNADKLIETVYDILNTH